MNVVSKVMRGQGLFARAARGTIWSMAGFAASQAIRLASNLILTRLLFPEAFGLMTLVTVITVGVVMLSDVGVGISVSQSKRGDEQNFLDTAWTIQVIRGCILTVMLALVAWPASLLYKEPLLIPFLMVSAISVLIGGFNPIRIETAGRHMQLARVTLVDLLSQAIAVGATVILAWLTHSVWSLILGNVLGALAKLILAHLLIPGRPSRLAWEPKAALELIHFGKWIFASTAFGFFLGQGDRLVLGTYLSLEILGIYNVSQFLATAPMMLASTALQRVIIPLYRESMTDNSRAIAQRLTMMRRYFTAAFLLLEGMVAFLAVTLVNFMYDDRYVAAGPIAVLVALVQLPLIVGMTYDRSALAAGDSRSYFYNLAVRSVFQMTLFIIGAQLGGLPLALVGQLVAGVVGHAGYVWLARKSGVWDPWHDAVFGGMAFVLGAIVLWYNWSALMTLSAL